MDEQTQKEFIQFLMQQTGAKNEQELQQVIQKLGKEGMQKAFQAFQQAKQQEAQAIRARLGAKLQYVHSLNGNCPDGYSLQMFKAGGRICKKCIKNSKPVSKANGGSVMDSIKNEIKQRG